MIVRGTVIYLVFVLIKVNKCQMSDGVIPNVKTTLQALYPKGFRANISVDADVKMVMFDGEVFENSEKEPNERTGHIWGAGYKVSQGSWLFEDHDITLRVGQVIRYHIFTTPAFPDLSVDTAAFVKFNGTLTDYKSFTVTAIEDRSSTGEYCRPTVTKVRGRKVCGGETIFEDNFDTLREDWWQVEQYIPIDHPEYPFVSYQNDVVNGTFVADGQLYIFPRLQQEVPNSYFSGSILSGSLNFTNRCTRKRCFKQAFGSDILPPIVSGRLTSRLFEFKYGTIHVRAKFPQGDWLYPEILLEPLFNKYGGQEDILNILKVAMSNGNRDVSDYTSGSRTLEGGPIMNKRCQKVFRSYVSLAPITSFWSNTFREYTLQWTPGQIVLFVDGAKYAQISLSTSLEALSTLCLDGIVPEHLRSGNTYSFDDYYHITLGLAAGGTLVFPDSMTTEDGKPKPWRNHGQKAILQFWQDRDSWHKTWIKPELIIDYVKVVSIPYDIV